MPGDILQIRPTSNARVRYF